MVVVVLSSAAGVAVLLASAVKRLRRAATPVRTYHPDRDDMFSTLVIVSARALLYCKWTLQERSSTVMDSRHCVARTCGTKLPQLIAVRKPCALQAAQSERAARRRAEVELKANTGDHVKHEAQKVSLEEGTDAAGSIAAVPVPAAQLTTSDVQQAPFSVTQATASASPFAPATPLQRSGAGAASRRSRSRSGQQGAEQAAPAVDANHKMVHELLLDGTGAARTTVDQSTEDIVSGVKAVASRAFWDGLLARLAEHELRGDRAAVADDVTRLLQETQANLAALTPTSSQEGQCIAQAVDDAFDKVCITAPSAVT